MINEAYNHQFKLLVSPQNLSKMFRCLQYQLTAIEDVKYHSKQFLFQEERENIMDEICGTIMIQFVKI